MPDYVPLRVTCPFKRSQELLSTILKRIKDSERHRSITRIRNPCHCQCHVIYNNAVFWQLFHNGVAQQYMKYWKKPTIKCLSIEWYPLSCWFSYKSDLLTLSLVTIPRCLFLCFGFSNQNKNHLSQWRKL